MSSRDFQDRLAGIIAAVIVLWLLIIIGGRIWNGVMAATDSGPMHRPSEWRAK